MSRPNLADEVRNEIQLQLADLGFQRRRRQSRIELGPEVAGWLGLNSAYYQATDEVSVLPVIGIGHAKVERLIAEMTDWKYDPLVATVSSPLPSLMPREINHRWVFGRGEDHGHLIAEIKKAVEDYGLPFMRAGASLDALRQLVEAGTGHAHMLPYRLPAICLLQGDKAGARRALEKELAALGRREDVAAEHFRLFAARFDDHFLSEAGSA